MDEEARHGQVLSKDKQFEVVDYFVCLGTNINTNNIVSLWFQRKTTFANKFYFGLMKQWNSKII